MVSLGNEVAGGWETSTPKQGGALLEVATYGIATVVLATGANAQQSAQGQLPPLEVTAKAQPKQKKKAAAKKKAPAEPVEAAPAVAAPATPVNVTDGQSNDLTPASGNTLQSGTGIGRLPGSVQSTPQAITVISQKQLKEQQINTLDQALRTVPGITLSSGEGNGGMVGDQFRIRGFDAKNDIYFDGLRDFGVYTRDSFAYEQVQVFKGPSSEAFGQGTTGGAINVQAKEAHLGDKTSIEGTIGMGPLYRSVIDVNKQLTDTTAARVVVMGNDQDIVERDHVYSDRWGVLTDIGIGLGTSSEWHLSYLHQYNKQKPDQGVPTVWAPGQSYRLPVTEFGVDRDTYYGQRPDVDQSTVDMITSKYRGKVNDWLKVNNDTRFEFFDRTMIPTPATCNDACSDSFWATGDATYGFGAGGGSAYDQDAWGFQNITTAIAEFNTASLRHQLVAGVDVYYVNDQRISYSRVPAKTAGTLQDPQYEPNYSLILNRGSQKKAEATDVGLFVSDRVWFTPAFSVIGGVRWDTYDVTYRSLATGTWTETTDNPDWFSPKASVVWEPTKQQTYYFSYGTSATPPGTNPVNAPNPLGAGRQSTSVEENETFELGAKFSVLDGRLGLSGALFRVNKDNAHYTEADGDTVLTGQQQRVQGVELGVSGSITDEWFVMASYAYLDSEILSDPSNAANKGNPVPFVAPNNVSIWTTYDIASLVGVDGSLKLGGGITYADDLWLRADKTAKIPSYFTLDAVASYEINGYRVAVNGYNLTDELNYTGTFGGSEPASARAVPSAGRTIMATFGVTF